MFLNKLVIFTLLLSTLVPTYAITLKLSPEVDLLAIDGKKMPVNILKGAETLELSGGQHQILFQVNKPLHMPLSDTVWYHSPFLITTFNSQGIHSLRIELPTLKDEKDFRNFDQHMNYRLLNEQNQAINNQHDTLDITSETLHTNIEQQISNYNLSGKKAAVPSFALAVKSQEHSSEPHSEHQVLP
jgi:uncharacterized protein YccT (UPF0319 family)